MGIIQGQKRVFRKGGVLGEGVLRKGVFRGRGLGKEENQEKPIGMRM